MNVLSTPFITRCRIGPFWKSNSNLFLGNFANSTSLAAAISNFRIELIKNPDESKFHYLNSPDNVSYLKVWKFIFHPLDWIWLGAVECWWFTLASSWIFDRAVNLRTTKLRSRSIWSFQVRCESLDIWRKSEKVLLYLDKVGEDIFCAGLTLKNLVKSYWRNGKVETNWVFPRHLQL